jgi:hypothetical protein
MAIILPIATKFNDSGIKKAQASFGSMGGSIKKLVGVAAGIAGVGLAIRGIGGAVKAASEDAKGAKLLAASMVNAAGATKGQITQTEDFIQKLQLQTSVLDDELRPAMALLVRSTGSVSESQKLLSLATDVSAGSGKDLTMVTQAIAKATNGQYASLNKLIPGISKAKDPMAELEKRFAGLAEVAANNDPFKKFQVVMNDLQETLGAALLPVITKLINALMPLIVSVAPLLAKVIEALTPIFDAIIAVLPGLMEAMQPIIEIVKMLATSFGDVLGKTIIALMPTIIKVAEIISSVLGMVLPVITEMFGALLPVIMPFIDALLMIVKALLPIIPPILQLVMAFMPLVTSILPPLTTLLLALVPVITLVANLFTSLLTPVIDIVAMLAKWLGDILGDRINFIVGLVKGLMPIFKTVFTFIGDFVKGIFQGVINGFKGFVNFLIDAINGVIGGLNSVLDGVAIATAGTVNLQIEPIPKLAKGGIVMPSPGGSIVNVAEAGQPEAIIPLNKMGSLGGSTYNITVNAGAGSNGATIGTEIVNAIKAFERSNGKGWRS